MYFRKEHIGMQVTPNRSALKPGWFNPDNMYVLTGLDDDGDAYFVNSLGNHWCPRQGDWEVSIPTKGGTVMSNIVKKIKDLALSKDDRLLREQGITDDCGQLTEEGRQVLEQVLFTAHKGAVVTLVQNVADAEKAEKKKK